MEKSVLFFLSNPVLYFLLLYYSPLKTNKYSNRKYQHVFDVKIFYDIIFPLIRRHVVPRLLSSGYCSAVFLRPNCSGVFDVVQVVPKEYLIPRKV